LEHNLTPRYVPDGIETHVCVSRERVAAAGASTGSSADPSSDGSSTSVQYREGHVTEAILEQIEGGVIDLGETDFYLCGNPDMVQEVRAMLLERGARYVYQEAY
jgi:NAD(P)H-flavin reductase